MSRPGVLQASIAWGVASGLLLADSHLYAHPAASLATMLLCGMSVACVFFLIRWSRNRSRAILQSAFALGGAALVWMVSHRLLLYSPRVGVWADALALLLRGLGAAAESDQGYIIVGRGIDCIAIDGASLFVSLPWFCAWAAIVTLYAAFDRQRKAVLLYAWSVAGLGLVLSAGLAIATVLGLREMAGPGDLPPVLEAWDYRLIVLVGAWATLVYAVGAPFQLAASAGDSQKQPLHIGSVAASGLGALLVWWALFHGEVALGTRFRLLIDDRLSEKWEPSAEVLTRDRVGDFGAYSFASLSEYLSRRLDVAVNVDRLYTDAVLSAVDILMFKTPGVWLDDIEERRIASWVKQGGVLILVGDHTDLNGSSTRLNGLARLGGVGFNFDALQSSHGGFESVPGRQLADHPLFDGAATIGLMTGCSLEIDWPARPLAVAQRTLGKPGDYAGSSHFGGRGAGLEAWQGSKVVAAAGAFGDGRILCFSDSTVFSSFALALDGHTDLLDRIVRYAMRAWGPAWLGDVALGAGMALLLSAWLSGRRSGSFVLGLTAAIAGVIIMRVCNATPEGQVLPAMQSRAAPVVGLLASLGDGRFPPALGAPQPMSIGRSLTTLTTLPLRLGWEVAVVHSLDRLESFSSALICAPEESAFSSDVKSRLRRWVSSGGRLMIVCDGELERERSSAILALALGNGVTVTAGSMRDEEVFEARCGRGAAILVGKLELMDSRMIGHSMALPSVAERLLLERAYSALALAGISETPRGGYSILRE